MRGNKYVFHSDCRYATGGSFRRVRLVPVSLDGHVWQSE